MPEALRIAIVGAESTGKTALAQALAGCLPGLTGLRCTWVPEHLRAWCDAQGRTPRPDEQAGIAREQQAQIDAAAATHDVVLCDTTPLMTAVYSDLLFQDTALHASAVAGQRGYALTLLMALDVAWQPDGLQRDGPQVRLPVDSRLRALLIGQALPWALVSGQGPARVESALDALAPLLRARLGQPGEPVDGHPDEHAGRVEPPAHERAHERAPDRAPERAPAARASGLFTRLADRDAAPAARAWVCNDCDLPDCEHALWRGA